MTYVRKSLSLKSLLLFPLVFLFSWQFFFHISINVGPDIYSECIGRFFLPMENTACVKAFVVRFVIGISFVASLVFCVDSIHPGSVFMFIRKNPRVSVCEPSDGLMSHCVLDETLLLFRKLSFAPSSHPPRTSIKKSDILTPKMKKMREKNHIPSA